MAERLCDCGAAIADPDPALAHDKLVRDAAEEICDAEQFDDDRSFTLEDRELISNLRLALANRQPQEPRATTMQIAVKATCDARGEVVEAARAWRCASSDESQGATWGLMMALARLDEVEKGGGK